MAADLSSLPSIEHLVRKSAKRTHSLFSANEAFLHADDSDRSYVPSPSLCTNRVVLINSSNHSTKLRLAAKINAEYGNAKTLPAALLAQQKGGLGPARPGQPQPQTNGGRKMIEGELHVRGWGGQERAMEQEARRERWAERDGCACVCVRALDGNAPAGVARSVSSLRGRCRPLYNNLKSRPQAPADSALRRSPIRNRQDDPRTLVRSPAHCPLPF